MVPDSFDRFCCDNGSEIDRIASLFVDYEPGGGVDRPRLMGWLRQFGPQHRGLALSLASRIRYHGMAAINAAMKPLHALVRGQVGSDLSSVLFVPFGRTAESGEGIAWKYRTVNQLGSHSDRFVNLNELPSAVFEHDDPKVVFLDDFIGTGKQACHSWNGMICGLVSRPVELYLAVIASVPEGAQRVERETPLRVISLHTIGERHRLLSSSNTAFSGAQKKAIGNYCRRAGNTPLGFGNLGLLVSFAYGSPNNTISVIRGSKRQEPWRGLLPRWEDLP